MAKKKSQVEEDFYPGNSSEYGGYSPISQPQDTWPQGGIIEALGSPRKIITAGAVLLVAVLLVVLLFNLLGQKNNFLLFGPNGEQLKGRVSISANGSLVDSKSLDGKTLSLQGNPGDTIKGTVKTSILGKVKSVKVLIKTGGQVRTIKLSSEDVYIDENGVIHFLFNPSDDLGIGFYFDENAGEYFPDNNEPLDLTFEFVVETPDGQTIVIELPVDYNAQQFSGDNCLALDKSYVAQETGFGLAGVSAKLRISCEVGEVDSFVEWKSQRMGNVEVIAGNFASAAVLTDKNRPFVLNPAMEDKDIRIVFTPFREFAGQKASFVVHFVSENSDAKMEMNLALDNLEQCVRISPQKIDISPNDDSASFTIDASSCASKSIQISLCDNDPNCAGGAEGGINLSENFFVLDPKNSFSKIVTVSRAQIPGAYGVSISAKIPGTEKVSLGEQQVLVEPKQGAAVVPEKFVVSFVGSGATDSVRVKNNSLTEDVPVQASICSLYNSSLKTGGSVPFGSGAFTYGNSSGSWWVDLALSLRQGAKNYSGTGKYVSALTNALARVDSARLAAQLASSQRNALIKRAFLDVVQTKKSVDQLLLSAQDMKKKVDDLAAQANKNNDFKNTDMAAKYISLTAAAGSFIAITAPTCAGATSASSSTSSFAGTASSCPASAAQANTANTQVIAAASISCTEVVNNGYSLYNQINQELNPTTPDLDPTKSAEQGQQYLDLIQSAKNHTDNAYEYAKQALASASIDSLNSASGNDADAQRLLQLAQQENSIASQNLLDARIALTNAANEITVLQQQEADTMNMVSQWAGLVTQIINGVSQIISGNTAALGLLQKAVTSVIGAGSAAGASCNPFEPQCCPVPGVATVTAGVINSAIPNYGTMGSTLAGVGTAVGVLTSGYETWRSLDTQLGQAIINATTSYNTNLGYIDDSLLKSRTSEASLPGAVSAAQWLSTEEQNSSIAAGYNDSIATLDGEFDKKRLAGIIGTAVSNGFANGAYEGGVYSTSDTTGLSFAAAPNTKPSPQKRISLDAQEMAENCDNTVSLTLPDYSINLVNDAKQINISNEGVSASWIKGTEEVAGVFESQEVGVLFANSNLKKNSYGTVEFVATKHSHANPTQISSSFGPFNIPDEKQEEQSFKYHFKFNVTPTKNTNYAPQNSTCSIGLMNGSNSAGALPKVILSWDWSSVNSLSQKSDANKQSAYKAAFVGAGSSDEPFLDATQLTILLSKKMGTLDAMLQQARLACPINPAIVLYNSVKSSDANAASEQTDLPSCYLPLTTREYDGKPAIYYFMEGQSFSSSNAPTDAEKFSTADDLLGLVDFNANLMRDGYGTEFQYDFTSNYSRQILKAGPSFTDPLNGFSRYLRSTDLTYFSSEAKLLQRKNYWALPDAGKYRIRALVDFTGDGKLFENSSPAAKILFTIDLVEPVGTNSSPLYYLPTDGSTGLSAANSRNSYGSSVTGSGTSFPILTEQGAVLDPQQKNSLVKPAYLNLSDFSLLNSLPSLRGRLLDISYNYDTTTASDAGSKIIFSPVYATPLLLEIDGNTGASPGAFYSISNGNYTSSSKTGSMLLASGLSNCSNLSVGKVSDSVYYSPDSQQSGSIFGYSLPPATSGGKTFLQTVAYSPISSDYSISSAQGSISSPSGSASGSAKLPLNGASGMAFNSKPSSSAGSMEKLFEGVDAGSVCVAELGSRDVFWLPDEKVFAAKDANTQSLSTLRAKAMSDCAK